MKKINHVITEYVQQGNSGTSTCPDKKICEWAYILDTKKMIVTKVKVKEKL